MLEDNFRKLARNLEIYVYIFANVYVYTYWNIFLYSTYMWWKC